MADDASQIPEGPQPTGQTENLSAAHRARLRPEALRALDSSLEERLRVITEDKFILYEDSKRVLGIIKDLLGRSVSERPSSYLFTGPSGSGKTAIINRFDRDYGGDSTRKVGVNELARVLIVPLPSRPTDPRIALAIARRVNVPVFSRQPSREVSDLILRELRKRETRILFLLEFDNLEPLSEQERKISLDFIKDFTNQGISVIGVGTEPSVHLVAKDEELSTRLRPLRLQGFASDEEFKSFLTTLETFYPFRAPSNLPLCAAEILSRTRGVVGEVILLVNEAAVWAARHSAESISAQALKECNYVPPARPPSER